MFDNHNVSIHPDTGAVLPGIHPSTTVRKDETPEHGLCSTGVLVKIAQEIGEAMCMTAEHNNMEIGQ